MKNNELNEFVEEWLRFSKADLDAAEFLYENMHPKPIEIICYHCQQSAEKALKSIMVANDIDPIKTHNLTDLYSECIDLCPDIKGLDKMCETLNRYGTQPRYPYEIEIFDYEAKTALHNAKFIFEKIGNIFKNA